MGLVKCTIGEMFSAAAGQFKDRIAVAYNGISYSWHDLDLLSDVLASRFTDRGIREQDHVALFGTNSASWIITFIALEKIGAVPALINSSYKKRELVQVMRVADAKWLCYGDTSSLDEDPDMVSTASHKMGSEFGGIIDIRESELNLPALLKEYAGFEFKAETKAVCSDLACMIYTSGTTKDPKCVMHDHLSMVNDAISTVERIGLGPQDTICMSQPLFHIFPLVSGLLGSFQSGAMLAVVSHFGSESILGNIQKYGCTVINGVPANFLSLISNAKFKDYKTDSIRLISIGGASVSEAQVAAIREAFSPAVVMKNYGLSEACNLCNSDPGDSHAAIARTVGKAYPGIQLGIMDPVTKQLLGAGERGEIVVKGYTVMLGYYSSKGCETPASPIDENGWLHTGDLGVLDTEGCLAIVGRIKDIIIRGGENVNPGEIANEIMKYEPVFNALVVGAPHPILGEEIIACLVLENPDDYDEAELRSIINVRLARYKMPEFFFIYDSFPLKSNGKVDMLALKKDAAEKAKALHADDARYMSAQKIC